MSGWLPVLLFEDIVFRKRFWHFGISATLTVSAKGPKHVKRQSIMCSYSVYHRSRRNLILGIQYYRDRPGSTFPRNDHDKGSYFFWQAWMTLSTASTKLRSSGFENSAEPRYIFNLAEQGITIDQSRNIQFR